MKKKRKFNLRLSMSILFGLMGISLLLYPVVYDKLREGVRDEISYNYDSSLSELTEDERQAELTKAKEYNEALWKRQQAKGIYTEIPDYYSIANVDGKNGALGYIDIPAIGITRMPFFHGTSSTVLDKALGHIPETSIPIGGENTHAFITGHAGLQNQVLFTYLNQLKEGDYFIVYILGETLKYEIDDISTVEPTDTSVLTIQEGKDLITLQTCTPIDLNSHRLLITAHRVEYNEETLKNDISNTPKTKFLTYEQKALIGIGLFLFVIILIYIIQKYRKKRNREETK